MEVEDDIVIVVVRKQEKYFFSLRCLKSVKRQDDERWECQRVD